MQIPRTIEETELSALTSIYNSTPDILKDERLKNCLISSVYNLKNIIRKSNNPQLVAEAFYRISLLRFIHCGKVIQSKAHQPTQLEIDVYSVKYDLVVNSLRTYVNVEIVFDDQNAELIKLSSLLEDILKYSNHFFEA